VAQRDHEVGAVSTGEAGGPNANGPLVGRLALARLEADVAYFQARLDFLDQPETSNQAAQRKAFKHLFNGLSGQVAAAKQAQSNTYSVGGLFEE
jgi:hypothetical protein